MRCSTQQSNQAHAFMQILLSYKIGFDDQQVDLVHIGYFIERNIPNLVFWSHIDTGDIDLD